MSLNNKIKLAYLFEPYPIFYQPYIQHVIQKLENESNIEFSIKAFKKNGKIDDSIEIFPNYKKRSFLKFLNSFQSKYRNLSYPEIKLIDKDIIHIQHSFLFPKIENILKLPANKRPKIIITLRGGETYIKPWKSEKWKKFYAYDSKNVDAFVVMSNNQKEYLQKWGVASNKIHVIPISFGNPFQVAPKHADDKEFKVVSVFRVCWEKNIDGNLLVIKHLKEKGLNVKYYIYGDGPAMSQIYYLIDRYNIQDCVEILGRVKNEKLKNELPTYDFLLQLSLSESLSLSVIEAMSYGVVPIVSNAGGLPEVIENNESGITIDSYDVAGAADAIIKLWNDKELYFQFSENAIKKAQENFNTDIEVNRLLELYQNIL